MRLALLFLTLGVVGGAAIGTRVPEDKLTVRTQYITRPDPRVASWILRVQELEEEQRALSILATQAITGQEMREFFEVVSGPMVPEEGATPTTVTTAQRAPQTPATTQPTQPTQRTPPTTEQRGRGRG